MRDHFCKQTLISQVLSSLNEKYSEMLQYLTAHQSWKQKKYRFFQEITSNLEKYTNFTTSQSTGQLHLKTQFLIWVSVCLDLSCDKSWIFKTVEVTITLEWKTQFVKIVLFPKGKYLFAFWVCNCVSLMFHKSTFLPLVILTMSINQGGFRSLGNFDFRTWNHFSCYFRNK